MIHLKWSANFLVTLFNWLVETLRSWLGSERVDDWLGIRLHLASLLGIEATVDPNVLGLHSESFVTCLTKLLECLRAEAALTPLGQLLWVFRIRCLIKNRIQATRCFAAHPEILTISVARPIFVTGLHRTGTTALHRTFYKWVQESKCKKFQTLPLELALNPAPYSRSPPFAEHPMRKRSRTLFHLFLNLVASESQAVHFCNPDEPEEDMLLMELSLMSQMSPILYHIPSYSTWLATRDKRPMYDWLRQSLQLIMWQRPMAEALQPWLLKAPNHLPHLGTLFEVFPDACVIWIHRSLSECCSSSVSALAHARSLFSSTEWSLEDRFAEWLRVSEDALSESREVKVPAAAALIHFPYHGLRCAFAWASLFECLSSRKYMSADLADQLQARVVDELEREPRTQPFQSLHQYPNIETQWILDAVLRSKALRTYNGEFDAWLRRRQVKGKPLALLST